MTTKTYETASGLELTDEDIQALADEAEAGYDVSGMPGARWAFKDEFAWLLKSIESLFEACAKPGGVYGCKGCGMDLPAREQAKHLELHRKQIGGVKREAKQTAPHGIRRQTVGTDGLPEHRRPVVERIISMRQGESMSYTDIAKALNRDEVPSFGGGKGWYAVTVRAQYLKYTSEAS